MDPEPFVLLSARTVSALLDPLSREWLDYPDCRNRGEKRVRRARDPWINQECVIQFNVTPGSSGVFWGRNAISLADGNPHDDTFSSAWGIDTTVAKLVRALFTCRWFEMLRDKGRRMCRNKLNNAKLEFNTDNIKKWTNITGNTEREYCGDESIFGKFMFFSFEYRGTCGFRAEKPQYDWHTASCNVT